MVPVMISSSIGVKKNGHIVRQKKALTIEQINIEMPKEKIINIIVSSEAQRTGIKQLNSIE